MSLKRIIAGGAIVRNQELIAPVHIDIQNGVIVSVSESCPKEPATEIINLPHLLLFPGLVNAHCHLELSKIPPVKQQSFVDWVEDLIKIKPDISKQQWLGSVEWGLKQLELSGVTTIMDHISFDVPIEAHQNAKQRIIGFGEVLGTRDFLANLSESELRKKQALAQFEFHISPHGIYSLNPPALKTLFKNKHKFSIHCQESHEESEYFENQTGPLWDFLVSKSGPESEPFRSHKAHSSIQFVNDTQESFENTLVIHGNHLSQQDLDILENTKNCCLVHCPRSYEYFKHEGFDLEALLNQNIPVALGTDSHASNEGFNFLHEIQFFLENHPKVNFNQLMPMITTNSCDSLGLKNIGRIEQGFVGDLIGFEWDGKQDPLDVLKSRDHVDFFERSPS